jgi:hypothetical protein
VPPGAGSRRPDVGESGKARNGDFFAIEASHSDSATYQAFLDEADRQIAFQRTTNIMKNNY